MTGKPSRQIQVTPSEGGWRAAFMAMASPCELLLDGGDQRLAQRLGARVAQEAWRIEQKFSRYRDDNIVAKINQANGQPIKVDRETARLLDYAAQCWRLSDSRFDLTAGILRRVWTFDGSDNIPDDRAVEALLPLIGWEKLAWDGKKLGLKAGMEIDFGGIGKEYAVDRALGLIAKDCPVPYLLNFGGDLACSGPRQSGQAWTIGIEPAQTGVTIKPIELYQGALATSGDARRFLRHEGIRYPHVLDPRNGWPVISAPSSVTVAADNCSEAGFVATLAMLHGEQAADFLSNSGFSYWLQ